MDEITLVILIDAGRYDYIDSLPYIKSLKEKGVYAKKLYNPGGYCERSCFMTGAGPETTGNYFAMSLMPIGYKRAPWEPTFNVPTHLRDRLCMTEDVMPDTDEGAFYNPDTDTVIESIWDVMREEGKTWAFEACLALGIQQHKGKTTHGSRVNQLLSKILQESPDVAYIQFSEIDQQAHLFNHDEGYMKGVLTWADGEVKRLVEEIEKAYDKVNLIIFGDHGQTLVTDRVDIPIEYPGFHEGWDYLFLKSSAAIQFWVFNDLVEDKILNDPILNKYGVFIPSPSHRQGDLIWRANEGVLLTPCHFHGKWEPTTSMHGYDPMIDSEKGFAIVVDGEHKGEIEEVSLIDIGPTICDVMGIRYPKFNEGKSLCTLSKEK